MASCSCSSLSRSPRLNIIRISAIIRTTLLVIIVLFDLDSLAECLRRASRPRIAVHILWMGARLRMRVGAHTVEVWGPGHDALAGGRYANEAWIAWVEVWWGPGAGAGELWVARAGGVGLFDGIGGEVGG